MHERDLNGTEASIAPPARRRAFLTKALVAAGVGTALLAIGYGGRRTPTHVTADPPRITQPPAVVTPTPTPAQTRRPRVELVFALDTTSSMSGLIEGAKRKIWSLASFVA